MKYIFVAAFVLVGVWNSVTGLRCLRCNEVFNPILCNYIVKCGAGEVCGIEQVRNENGNLRYNLGCKSTQTCNDIKNFTDTSALTRSSHTSTYTTVCHECCDKDICNSAGCGQLGYPTDIGPICMDCQDIENAGECDKISACDRDEMCHIHEKVAFHLKLFTSSCVPKYVCDATHGFIFGKRKRRDEDGVKTRSSTFCSQCCVGNLCNDHCGTTVATGSTVIHKSTTMSTPITPHATGTPPFTITFTSCGRTGNSVPTLSYCQSVYNYVWPRNQTNFNVISGVQKWTIPETAYYVIDAYGAGGGDGNLQPHLLGGGNGSRIRGTFYLNSSTVLNIVVGQRGMDGGGSEPGGGGGGTFVFIGRVGGSGLLIAAGGGGGAGEEDTHSGYDGSDTNFALTGSGPVGSAISVNGGFGYGGVGGNVTSAGAGWYNDGSAHRGSDTAYPGRRWTGGASPGSGAGGGGFGGGGSGVSTNGGGGGGGYTGGPGISSSNRTYWGGSGGGSFNGGTNQMNITGFNSGNGKVIVTKL